MKTSIYYIAILFTSMYLTSCFMEIDTVPQERQTKTVVTSEGSIYSEITFFKVYENATAQVLIEPRGTWDLAFQSAFEGNNVLVNYTVSGTAINTKTTNFDNVDKKTLLMNYSPQMIGSLTIQLIQISKILQRLMVGKMEKSL